jgi:transcriptional regulator with XRE-family HTH domain
MARQRQRLIKAREIAGKTREQVAEALRVSVRTIERLETGETRNPQIGRRSELAKLYKLTPAELRVVLNGDDEPVPAVNGHAVPDWLTLYASLEQQASQLWAWQPFTVHALLQTPDYAAAVEQADPVPGDVARLVDLRMTRQAVLTREPDPLHLSVVLDESVLRRVTGSQEVMAAQLNQLVKTAELPNVDIRVLPLHAGIHAAAFGTFTVLASSGISTPQMVCVEDRTGHRYLESTHAVDVHFAVFNHLARLAFPSDESRDVIRTAAKETRHD